MAVVIAISERDFHRFKSREKAVLQQRLEMPKLSLLEAIAALKAAKCRYRIRNNRVIVLVQVPQTLKMAMERVTDVLHSVADKGASHKGVLAPRSALAAAGRFYA